MALTRFLHIDFETRSSVSIADCGLFKYMESPDFRILLTAYAYDDGPVLLIDHTKGGVWPASLLHDLFDPGVTKVAHNAAFERNAIRTQLLGRYCPPEQWLDTMILAANCGLPLSLGQCSEALLLPQDKAKDKRGKDLIRKFCVPKKDGTFNDPKDFPEDWDTFCEYNRQDVVAERTIHSLLEQWTPDETEHRLWCLDARINERGVPVDLQLAKEAVEMGSRYKAELTERAIELTGLDNPNSVSQVKNWLEEQEGIEVPSLGKKVVADVVAKLETNEAKEFMDLRSKLSKTSVKKYDKMLVSACKDAHIRGCFQFFGGHTGRWAGRLVQLQNLSQNHMSDLAVARDLVRAGDYETVAALYDSVTGTLSELLRTALIPEPGHRFVVADYSAIEARVLSYLASEEWRLDVFRKGGDIYCASASQMFKVPVVKHGENGHLRQKGKIAELALGYGGGVNALLAFGADKMGMTAEDMGETVALWRQSSPKICALWKKLERAAILCTQRHTEVDSGVPGVKFRWERGIMWMSLPSGRRMAYFNPEYKLMKRRVGEGMALSYMVLNQTTKKWMRCETFGGRLTENLVQAVARDCLRESMLALEAEGWDIRAHVHDEIICTEPIDGRGWEDMAEVMGRELSWAPGLPLRGDGYTCPYYMKD